jgi:hypothetical protein
VAAEGDETAASVDLVHRRWCSSFFGSVAKPRAVKNVLRQAYAGNPDAVTDELVSFILTPGLQPGAAAVFLEFISFCTRPSLRSGQWFVCCESGNPNPSR